MSKNAVGEFIYERGTRSTKYRRRRIPADLRAAYHPNKRILLLIAKKKPDPQIGL